jgi:hypothetical protein
MLYADCSIYKENKTQNPTTYMGIGIVKVEKIKSRLTILFNNALFTNALINLIY